MSLPMLRTGAFWVLCLAVALASWRFLALGVELSMPIMAHHIEPRALSLYAHIGLAPVALAVMPFQFSIRLRQGRPRLHRWLGRVYGLSVLLSGLGGLHLALTTAAGPMAASGFALLSVLWIAVTGRAVWLAMQRRLAEHRAWMIRSAALTFAAVTLRLYLPILVGIFGFETGYPPLAWISWVPNLILVEYWLRHTRPARG